MYLGIVYRGLGNFTSNKPIYTPEDIKGLNARDFLFRLTYLHDDRIKYLQIDNG